MGCQYCGGPLGGSASDDFCSPEHQAAWSAERVGTSPEKPPIVIESTRRPVNYNPPAALVECLQASGIDVEHVSGWHQMSPERMPPVEGVDIPAEPGSWWTAGPGVEVEEVAPGVAVASAPAEDGEQR